MKRAITKLKTEVLSKKELSGISGKVLDQSISEYLKKNKIIVDDNIPEKDLKIIVKEIRESLRLMHGRFQISTKDRDKSLDLEDYDNILRSHRSTFERIDFYPKIKEIISSLKPSSIIDIASGLNPLAVARKDFRYLAIDINNDEIKIINSFFEKNKINGKALCEDAAALEYKKLGKFDLCLIFKFLDFIEDSHKKAEFFLKNVNAPVFFISFATKSISGRSSRQPRKIWLERIIAKINYKFETYQFDNEIFYLVRK